ncbi:hypothetical protein [Alishewanella longhuensis]
MDAKVLTGRVHGVFGVQYRLQAAWRFDLSDLLEAGGENYYLVKGVAHILNLKLPQVTQVQN